MRLRPVLISVVLAGCAGGAAHSRANPIDIGIPPVSPKPGPTTTTTSSAPPRVKTAGLVAFPSCAALLDAVRSEASAEVTPYGFQQSYVSPGMPMRVDGATNGAVAGGATPAAAPAMPASGPSSFSATNNQEAGVDELDAAKTDGHLLVALAGGQLRVTDVSSSTPRQRGAVAANGSGLFLVGSDAVVVGYGSGPIASGGGTATSGTATSGGGTASPSGGGTATPPGAPAVAPTPQPYAPSTTVTVFSLADPDHPTQVRSFSVSGSEVAARLIGHTVKLVVASMPTVVMSAQGPTPAASLAANRAAIAKAPLNDWLPTIVDGHGQAHLASCTSMAYPPQRSGVGTISVLSIDPSKDQPGTPVSVLGTPGTVYASTTDLYVATSSFDQQQAAIDGNPFANERTMIHDFDITQDTAVYRGSGTVLGEPLNQYALSEYNGDLRVATTTGIPQPPPFEGAPVPAADGSQSMVTVLRPANGSLQVVGVIGGLGVTQRIYGVRFVGPLGYVVTFRQMDPLYIIDLSKPSTPILKGALELTGYSAYMHPLDASRLLGVGVAADQDGRRQGLQVSLFDVGNASHPALLAQSKIDNAYAAVENDPHAFLWWAPTGTVVLPLNGQGAVVLRVAGSSLAIAGTLSPPTQPQPCEYPPPPSAGPASPPSGPASSGGGSASPGGGSASPGGGPGSPAPMPPCRFSYGADIQRVFVVGDRLVSYGSSGVLVSNASTLGTEAWLPY